MSNLLLNDDNPMRVIELLASRLKRMVRKNSVLSTESPPAGCSGERTVFDGPADPTKRPVLDPLLTYLQNFELEIECMPMDYVLAGIYVERFLRANPSILLTYSNVHRLVLACLVSTVKFYKTHMRSERFAAVGQMTTKEMADIEEAAYHGMDNDSCIVDSEAIDEYCALLLREEEEAEPHSPSPAPSHMTPTPALPLRSAPSASQSAPSTASATTTAPAPPPAPTEGSCVICKFFGR